MCRTVLATGLALLLAALTATADWNVTEFGAVGDGQADNTVAFQKALDAAAKAGGGIVHVAAGQYRINGVLSIPGAVTLEGTFRVPPTDQREGRPALDGSVLLAFAGRGSQEGAPFIRLAGSMATLAGFIVTYPEWNPKDVPPTPYPPTVYAENNVNVAVLDCCFLNSYEAIHFQDSGRFLVRNVYGYPSFRGLYVDACYDIGRVENCHFWPFGMSYSDEGYCKWINLNGVAFEFARTDWQYVVNTFCFGYGVGYKFSTTKNGSCNGNFVGIGADSCRRAVVVDTAPGALDLLITNGEFVGRWASLDSVGVEIAGQSTGRVSLTNCAFWGPLDRCIWAEAPEARLTVIGCGFSDWDIGANDSPAVQVDGGKAILQGNSFVKEGLHIQVAKAVQSAIITGNQAPVGLRVENHAGERTQLATNEMDAMKWTRKALGHYQVAFGAQGDGRYVRCFHSKERAGPWRERGVREGKGTMRWAGPRASLVLPVQPRKEYALSMDLFVPSEAIDPGNGIYLGEKRIAEFPQQEGVAVVTGVIPPQNEKTVTLNIRCKSWVPKASGLSPNDARQLGIAVRALTLKAAGASARVFDANTGNWLEEAPPAQS